MVAALHRPTTSSLTSAISAATHLEAKVPDQVVGSDQLGKGGVVAASSHSAAGVSIAAAQQHISSTTTLVDWQAYVGDHTGFVAAVVVLLLVPVFIFAGCCLNRVFKRIAKQRAAERRRKQADHESAPASDDEYDSDRGSKPRAGAPPPAQAPPSPPPPPVNSAFLPVDAYLGVPPKQFVL